MPRNSRSRREKPLLASFEGRRTEGPREMVLRELNHKVGPYIEEQQARVKAHSSDDLLTLAETLLNFAKRGDLLSWLEQREGPRHI